MRKHRSAPCVRVAVAAILVTWSVTAGGQSSSVVPHADQLAEVLQRGLADGQVIGAQSAIGIREAPPQLAEYGVIAPGSRVKVDAETLFCIGSCSKPFASACLLTLVDSGRIDLDTPIDRWLPAFGDLTLADGGRAERAPTLRELLAHRGGIYSQKRGPMTADQTQAIRDFRLTLEESVAIIARQPLIADPGAQFAYSGAGYCVLGRAVEVATHQPFEEILQQRLARPLKLTRTTYFPSPAEMNIATGGFRQQGQVSADPRSPHRLGKDLRFPLIGGSLYSTAAETARFAQLILNRGTWSTGAVLSSESWNALTQQAYDDQTYGLGWTVRRANGQVSSMQHGGALYSHRSLIYLDVANETFAVVHWTLADAESPQEKAFRQQLLQAARQVTAP